MAGRPSLHCVAPKRKCSLKQPEWGLLSQEEALEARVRQLEGDLRGGGSETDAPPEFPTEDVGVPEDIPHPCVWPIVQQNVKREQTLGPRGVAAGLPAVTEFTTHTPYAPTLLSDLGKRCRQHPAEPLPPWLLCLWDKGATAFSAPQAKWKS